MTEWMMALFLFLIGAVLVISLIELTEMHDAVHQIDQYFRLENAKERAARHQLGLSEQDMLGLPTHVARRLDWRDVEDPDAVPNPPHHALPESRTPPPELFVDLAHGKSYRRERHVSGHYMWVENRPDTDWMDELKPSG